MLGRRETKLIDVDRMAASALDAFLGVEDSAGQGQNGNQPQPSRHRYGAAGAVAFGVALTVAARATYSRVANKLDLEQVAKNIEERLAG
jgi:hypothetical protein